MQFIKLLNTDSGKLYVNVEDICAILLSSSGQVATQVLMGPTNRGRTWFVLETPEQILEKIAMTNEIPVVLDKRNDP